MSQNHKNAPFHIPGDDIYALLKSHQIMNCLFYGVKYMTK